MDTSKGNKVSSLNFEHFGSGPDLHGECSTAIKCHVTPIYNSLVNHHWCCHVVSVDDLSAVLSVFFSACLSSLHLSFLLNKCCRAIRVDRKRGTLTGTNNGT
jgi:hypothetical protein